MNAQPAILSIAVLASFALAIGGVWLVRRGSDRKRGVLMIVMAVVLLANVVLWAMPVRAGVAAVSLNPLFGSRHESGRSLG